ncbi:hypothetical protein [Pseudorhodobacter sp. MZDSW-24AT]|uniref:phosphoribosyltransferase-like protein n=1 Tax=Pseudorhodobacter sp. MZDSW-24AT TaxID=2052957 RepID=UPI000C1DFD0E|nr:hypothetical protein [Pseudorhodobacter sp. MZDSW-24AT]PJF08426.1 hypothetical protein CUR21_13430 [Pseudorhodobacter sp. MZDSW-24AT]
MSKAVLIQSDATQWLDHFGISDRANAAKLLALVTLVPSDLLREKIIGLLEERLKSEPGPVALFNESERRKWKGEPNRLFKNEEKRANSARKGKRIVRTVGSRGPALVPQQRYIDELIGSEGVVGNILTQFRKTHQQNVFLSPGPDTFRSKCIRRFILVTDFIGSGSRIETYLDAAWRSTSVRSWWSRRGAAGLHFEVVAYAGTEAGIERVKRHPSQPQVFVEMRCPTIRTSFPPGEAARMEDLCIRHAPPDSKPLGFDEIGALIAFGHGMPNNAPAMFWKSTRLRRALFPERTTISAGSPFQSVSVQAHEEERLKLAAQTSVPARPIVPLDIETIVLSALRRSPRHAEAVSGRLGLELFRVRAAFVELRQRGWIDQYQQLTERGRVVVRRLANSEAQVVLPKLNEKPYFPESLRMPRDV